MEFDADTMAALAEVLAKASAGANSSNQVRDQQNLQRYGLQENAKAAQDRLALAAPGARLKTSLAGSVLNNFTPTQVKWGGPGSGLRGEVPTFEGGARGAIAGMDPKTRDLSNRIIEDQLLAQMRGGLSGGGMDTKVQEAPAVGQSSLLDKLLGGGATAASVLGALGKNGSGASGDIGKLIKDLFAKKVPQSGNAGVGGGDPFGDNLDSYDPFLNWSNPGMGLPGDPSGSSGVGPGMGDYRGANGYGNEPSLPPGFWDLYDDFGYTGPPIAGGGGSDSFDEYDWEE